MLENLRPQIAQGALAPCVPPFLTALVERDRTDRWTIDTIGAITRSLGFDNFMYGATVALKPKQEKNSYVFTTMPAEWIRRYDEMAYIEVDPRIESAWNSAVPLVWDAETFVGRNRRSDQFLADASLHGISSGVCFLIHLPQDCHVFISLSSSVERVDGLRQRTIARAIPDVMAFGHYFHEVFMRATIESNIAPRLAGAPLSPRERECLTMAARGMTTDDIAAALRISSRTVQYHFDSIRTKLRAANRQEAIALAMYSGVINV